MLISHKSNIQLALAMCAFLCVFLSFAYLPKNAVAFIADGELSVVELLSAFNYLLAFIFAIHALKVSRGVLKAHFVFWAFMCLLFFGEETSYLQHFLGYGTPENIAQLNAQGEFNLHNLDIFQGGSLFQLSNEGILKTVFTSQNLFQIGFVGYFFVLPFLFKTSNFFERVLARYAVPILSLGTAAYFFAILFISSLATISSLDDPFIKSAVAETRELFYSCVILFFLFKANVLANSTPVYR